MIRVCCTSYSLWKYFSEGKATLESFADFCSSLGMDGVELHNRHFVSIDDSYLRRLKAKIDSLGLKIASIGASNNFAIPSIDELRRQVGHVKSWVEVASKMGSPVLRVFAGHIALGVDYRAMVKQAVEGFKECAEYAEGFGVVLGLENHGNFCNDADEILDIIREVGSKHLRTLPDTGNFPKDKYEQLRKVAPLAVHVHAKSYSFNEEGYEETLDYGRIVEMFKEAGYGGFFSIEYEGKEDQMDGVRKSLIMLRKHF